MRSDAALSALGGVALADSIVVSLRQLGVVSRLPDVSWRGFDANKVTTSPEAYPFGVPDAVPASAFYLTELALLAARRRTHGKRRRWIDRALALCVGGGALAAGYYAYQMAFVEKRVCIYCITALAANMAMVPLVWRMFREDEPHVGFRLPEAAP